MSRNSYTASERRGIVAIAVIALLIIGCGWGISMCSGGIGAENEIPVVMEHPDMIDSAAVKKNLEKKTKKTERKKTKSSNKSKPKKTYRQRSPLDEPV